MVYGIFDNPLIRTSLVHIDIAGLRAMTPFARR
jgi:hypothetical protein